MKLEIIIIVIIIKLVQSYVFAHGHVLSTLLSGASNRSSSTLYARSSLLHAIRYTLCTRIQRLRASLSFDALCIGGTFVSLVCRIRLWFAPDQSRQGRTLRQRFSSLLHHGLALIFAVAPGRIRRLVEHPDVAPCQRGLWVEKRVVHVDSPRLAIEHALH